MEENIAQKENNSAKFAFFYLLSLVALGFMSTSVGVVLFQIINKTIVDAIASYSARFDPNAIKFAIASIIIAAPIYYFTVYKINKSLITGELDKASGVRRWLTYFILLVASVTMIGWLIGTIYNFLDGELTAKFILKAVTAISIAAAVFSYYLYDIKRDPTVAKDKFVQIAFYVSLVAVIAALIAAFVFTPSPTLVRMQKQDQDTLNKFTQIDSAITQYYTDQKKMPATLDELLNSKYYLAEKDLKDAITEKPFDYKLTADNTYELCAEFRTSNKTDDQVYYDEYMKTRWPHDSGYQCFKQPVYSTIEAKVRDVEVQGIVK